MFPHKINVTVNSDRPDFRVFGTFLFGEEMHNYESEGDSQEVYSRDWTELYMSSREIDWCFSIDKITDDPLTFEVSSKQQHTMYAIAYFLARETYGEVIEKDGSILLLSDVVKLTGNFQLNKHLAIADQSIWRTTSEENPYPHLPESEFDFFKATMSSTRVASYHLGCLDGSVFMDFNESKDGRITLCRISFDGFGCCSLGDDTNYLDAESSTLFLQEMKKFVMDQEVLAGLVKEVIRLNSDLIWEEALKRYRLVADDSLKKTELRWVK
ncbi:hypothetical protein D3C87_94820 [compost metagenome]